MAPTNVVVRLLLRSPLHFLLSDGLLLLTYMGRKSGKQYTIPVAYAREGDVVTVFTYHAWWKSLLGGAPVVVEIKRHRFHGRAEVIWNDEKALATELLAYLKKHPKAAQGYNIPLDAKGQPDPDAVRQAAQFMVMVRISLAPSAGQT
jgi:F420H(2)-dependent quinone reductase